ncbi:hypothetical protein SAMN04488021_10591 [Paracoccus aminovorans]|uniref:Flagellar assembly protein FliH n=2 Tax=Paracoccus aminovorans TaxID=34004 RepID=A0A1I2YQA0_9RHOB|nr:hypothetical protein JCM7685_2889 [Paracoccus aminovorans]SFH27824.1 hypothetical protein SAMN04488021_10591 [Paracoccus aminovorans]
MRPAPLRLDSFSAGNGRPGLTVTMLDVDEAYHRGHEQGLTEGRERSLDALSLALADCRQEMRASQQHEAALRREILAGLVPVLHAIVDLLAPRTQQSRLREALATEMTRLAEHAPDQAIVLRCPADLRPDLMDSLERARFPQAQVEDALPGQPVVQLVAGQGTIVFDPALVVGGLKTLIDDILTED